MVTNCTLSKIRGKRHFHESKRTIWSLARQITHRCICFLAAGAMIHITAGLSSRRKEWTTQRDFPNIRCCGRSKSIRQTVRGQSNLTASQNRYFSFSYPLPYPLQLLQHDTAFTAQTRKPLEIQAFCNSMIHHVTAPFQFKSGCHLQMKTS